MSTWTNTDEPGIKAHAEIDGKFKVDTTAKDPETGNMKRRRRTLENATMSEAIATREKLKAQIRQPPEKEATVSSKSITHFAASWVAEMRERDRWAPSTAEHNEQNLKLHILPYIGHLEVGELDRSAVRSWVDEVEEKTKSNGKPYSHESLRRWWRILKHLVKALYFEGHVDRRLIDWMDDMQGPKSNAGGRRTSGTLTADELVDFLDAAEQTAGHWYPYICTLACTGMRAGELAGLNREDVDREASTITIQRSFSRGEIKSTKTGEARIVPMVERVEQALRDHKERMLERGNLGFHDGILFPSTSGDRLYTSSLHDPMNRASNKVGLEMKVGPQVLRKTLNTLLKTDGVSRERIQSILGHESADAHAHYDEPNPDDLREPVADLLEGTG